MSIYDKISNAQETTWLTDGIAEAEAKSIIELAKISAKIERRRLELNMTQKEFAAYMNVSQGIGYVDHDELYLIRNLLF